MATRLALAAGAVCISLAWGPGTTPAETISNAEAQPLSVEQPLYLQEEEKARRPLMVAIDRTGGGAMLDEWGIDVSGHVELSYTFSDSAPPDGALNEDFLTGRVFDTQHDELWFNQAAIAISRTITPDDDPKLGYADRFNLGFKVEYLYGQDARLIHANGVTDHDTDDASRNEEDDLVQAYVTVGLPVGNGLLLTGGKFVTLIGWETINPTTNPFYSHSYLFGFAIPFTHTGVLAKYSFTDSVNATVGVVRGWEQALDDNNDDPSYIAQLGYTWNPRSGDSEPINVLLTAITGPEQNDVDGNYRTLFDLIFSTAVSDATTVGLNADYAYEDDAATDGDQAQWYGVALYAQHKLTGRCTLNARGEWFNDKDSARGLGTNVYEATVGLSIKPFPDNALGSNVVIRPEVRYDYAQESVFDNGTDHDQFTVAADVIFTF